MVEDWLLCDFHIHTQFSDGALPIEEVVDLYGQNGFDVIGISDHIADRRWIDEVEARGESPYSIPREKFGDYLQTLWKQSQRAWEQYEMLLLPGTEVTNNSDGYHILAIDVKRYIDPGQPVEQIVEQIHQQGGIAVAPHPHRGALEGTQQLMYLWDNHERFVNVFDAWEVANRDDLFNVVGLKKFNYIANSDFHQPRHLYSWKTLLRCERNAEAVKAAIRRNDAVSIYLFRPDKKPLGNGTTGERVEAMR
jgi:predicted metal-dependent phosphoesterase TrpH